MPKPVRILTADDHPFFRHALSSVLNKEPGFEVVAGAADGLEALELCRSLKPDLILMDVSMPRMTVSRLSVPSSESSLRS